MITIAVPKNQSARRNAENLRTDEALVSDSMQQENVGDRRNPNHNTGGFDGM